MKGLIITACHAWVQNLTFLRENFDSQKFGAILLYALQRHQSFHALILKA